MPVHLHRLRRILFYAVTMALLAIIQAAVQPDLAQATETAHQQKIFMPLMKSPVNLNSDGVVFVNNFRDRASLPPAAGDDALEANCLAHAQYMVENDHITHHQNANLPFATPAGQLCAERANAWLGTRHDLVAWTPHDPIRGWMASVPHRLWLIYPTMKTTGFGFYMDEESHMAAAAIDVLTGADFSADEAFKNWPVRYPAPGQKGVPTIPYPITLHWRYFGSQPELKDVRLTTLEGSPIPHTANTDLPAGHKGIQILPKINLPGSTTFLVTVKGVYENQPFTYHWQFATGSTAPWADDGVQASKMIIAGHEGLR